MTSRKLFYINARKIVSPCSYRKSLMIVEMMWVKYKVIQLEYAILLSFILSNVIFETLGQSISETSQNRKRTVSDPVSNFFSELGGLFLDADKAITDQTAPKVQFEDRLASRIFRPTNEYFNRIQTNYKNFQSRLGRLIGDTLGPKTAYSDRELSTVSPPIADEGKDTSARSFDKSEFNPFTSNKKYEISGDRLPNPIENSIDQNEECTAKKLDDPFLEYLRKERCSRTSRNEAEERIRKTMEKLMLDTRRASELLIPFGSRTLDQLSNNLIRRQGDVEPDDTKQQGRIIGDVLYSESLFDDQLRQFLRRHGQWFLDNPLLNRWRQPEVPSMEESTEATEVTEAFETSTTPEVASDAATVAEREVETTVVYEPTSTEQQRVLAKSGKLLQEYDPLPIESNYYNIANDDDGIVREVVDIAFEPQSVAGLETEEPETEVEPKDTVLLAFTPDGVPLKLRMGPEIENPIRYLHQVLKSASVSLNIPVESYDDLEPVGKEVLKLGSGILTRAIYIDVSNNNELKSLLKTLMKSKVSGKSF